MGLITLTGMAVIWTLWKGGPTKELGELALTLGLLAQAIGLYDAFGVWQSTKSLQVCLPELCKSALHKRCMDS